MKKETKRAKGSLSLKSRKSVSMNCLTLDVIIHMVVHLNYNCLDFEMFAV